MPTLADLRGQLRHRLMALANLERPEEVPEPVLRGQCVLLATLVMDPSGTLTRASSTHPTFVAQSGVPVVSEPKTSILCNRLIMLMLS